MSIVRRNSLRQREQHRPSRRGAIVVLVAFCLTLVLAMVAITIDGGGLLEQRRQAQATADAAALAAANSMFVNYSKELGSDLNGSAATAARAVAAANGYNTNGTNSILTVQPSPMPYTDGPNKNLPLPKGYVEVTVQYNQPRYFSAIIGTGAIPVKARAVARGRWEPSMVGIHVLDLYAKGALNSVGGSAATVTGGAKVIVNSSDPEAAITIGGTITTTELDVTGGINSTGQGGGFYGDINLGTPPQPDPLRNLPEVDPSTLIDQSHGNTHFANGNHTLSPGVYHGGITISGKGSATLLPGIYYMDGGGFSMSGQGNLIANGVMIFNAPNSNSDTVSITGSDSGSVTLTPPTSGIYQGLTVFQARASDAPVSISGSGSMYVTGTFYAANALMKVSGGGASQIGSQFISRFLEIDGN